MLQFGSHVGVLASPNQWAAANDSKTALFAGARRLPHERQPAAAIPRGTTTAARLSVQRLAQRHQARRTRAPAPSPSPTPLTLKTIRADVRKGGTKTVRGHNRKVPIT